MWSGLVSAYAAALVRLNRYRDAANVVDRGDDVVSERAGLRPRGRSRVCGRSRWRRSRWRSRDGDARGHFRAASRRPSSWPKSWRWRRPKRGSTATRSDGSVRRSRPRPEAAGRRAHGAAGREPQTLRAGPAVPHAVGGTASPSSFPGRIRASDLPDERQTSCDLAVGPRSAGGFRDAIALAPASCSTRTTDALQRSHAASHRRRLRGEGAADRHAAGCGRELHHAGPGRIDRSDRRRRRAPGQIGAVDVAAHIERRARGHCTRAT